MHCFRFKRKKNERKKTFYERKEENNRRELVALWSHTFEKWLQFSFLFSDLLNESIKEEPHTILCVRVDSKKKKIIINIIHGTHTHTSHYLCLFLLWRSRSLYLLFINFSDVWRKCLLRTFFFPVLALLITIWHRFERAVIIILNVHIIYIFSFSFCSSIKSDYSFSNFTTK